MRYRLFQVNIIFLPLKIIASATSLAESIFALLSIYLRIAFVHFVYFNSSTLYSVQINTDKNFLLNKVNLELFLFVHYIKYIISYPVVI